MKKWIVLFSIGICLLLANLDMTIVNLALPAFSTEFGASMQQIQLIIVSYLTAAAAFFCLFGKMADSVGRKRVFMFGAVLFMVSSLYIGAWSSTVTEIIVARFVQGAGFAATLGLALVLIANAFPPDQKGFATGVAVTITGVGMALGPPTGGFILQYLGWRWIFLLNVPLGLLSIVLTWIFVSDDAAGARRPLALDVAGVPFYLFALGCLIYVSNMLSTAATATLAAIAVAGLLSAAIFVRRSLRKPAPLINVTLLTSRGYLTVILIRMIFNYTMASFLFVLPLFMQNVLDYSKLKSGMWLLCMTIAVAFIAPLAGKVIDRVGFRIPTLVSMSLLFVSCAAFCVLGPATSSAIFVVGLFCFGVSNGMLTTATINGVTTQVPAKDAGTAIGLFFTLVMVGSMFGVSVAGLVLDRVSHAEVVARLAHAALPPAEPARAALFMAANGSRNIAESGLQNDAPTFAAATQIAHAAYYSALGKLMTGNALLTLVGVGLSIMLLKKQPSRSMSGATHAIEIPER
ncbi:MFS transporter [Burkholderia vietnamiensis]|uniref:MFS transporter n=1 Tax=Burkholderia vietnamiensis TaxID=60552 RepID=UPI000D7842B5|nr:MFS transporter [Burkholderia vietnamiensis]GBH25681.1 MFS transporter [Burkholderia vietnamiensis]